MRASITLFGVAGLLVVMGAARPSATGSPGAASRAPIVSARPQDPPPAPPAGTAAQNPPARGRGARPGGAGGARPNAIDPSKLATVNELLDAAEMNEADKFLQLTEDQYAQFVIRLRRLQMLRRQHQRQRQGAIVDLRKMINQQPPVEDALLEAPTRRIEALDREAAQSLLAARGQLDEILNLRQRAKFRVFEQVMEQRKLEIVARVVRSEVPKPAPAPIK